MATNSSAGNMVGTAFKTLLGSILKFLVLVIAWCIELVGKVLLKISEVIKNNAK